MINAVNVQKTFANNGNQIHVLSDVNLEIYDGDFTVIMGSSGLGKSMFGICNSYSSEVWSQGFCYDAPFCIQLHMDSRYDQPDNGGNNIYDDKKYTSGDEYSEKYNR